MVRWLRAIKEENQYLSNEREAIKRIYDIETLKLMEYNLPAPFLGWTSKRHPLNCILTQIWSRKICTKRYHFWPSISDRTENLLELGMKKIFLFKSSLFGCPKCDFVSEATWNDAQARWFLNLDKNHRRTGTHKLEEVENGDAHHAAFDGYGLYPKCSLRHFPNKRVKWLESFPTKEDSQGAMTPASQVLTIPSGCIR